MVERKCYNGSGIKARNVAELNKEKATYFSPICFNVIVYYKVTWR